MMVEDQTVGRAPAQAGTDWPSAALEHLLATDYNLTVAQYELLATLLAEAAPVAVGRLCTAGVQPADSLRSLLRDLENAGLLLREGAPSEQEVRLTINGRDRVRAAYAEVARMTFAPPQPVVGDAPTAAADTSPMRSAAQVTTLADAAQHSAEDGRRCLPRRTAGHPCGLVRTVPGLSEQAGAAPRRARALVG